MFLFRDFFILIDKLHNFCCIIDFLLAKILA